eukprot:comp12041_c0_seq1/m.6743 comp12041_c0_seq1/g.6743  ORF comp12041_c0_seq1/g.6743 comp12041_c0_seq1/m.6743 type:complete len:359 (-) comp12041_c0_seq1:222-1298(-)
MSKPNVLVLGGVGFIGRHLVQHLVEHDLANRIRIADKVLPQTAWATDAQKAAFGKCEFVQANLVNPASIAKAFDGEKWDYVFNCAGEARYGQTDEIYMERTKLQTVNCAKHAASVGAVRFVEVSTAQVYTSDKKPAKEGDKLSPWTKIAKYKLEAEEEIKKIDGLRPVVLRPAIVYGVSDVYGLTPRLIIAAVYKHLGKKMELLWSESLLMNTVHVTDVARAIWELKDKAGEIYNLADQSKSTQETINVLLDAVFGIKHSYLGLTLSTVAEKMSMASLCEDVNERHLEPWSEMCKHAGIENTPLTPYLDQELLFKNHLSVDGSKAESEGFKYQHPIVTKELLEEVVNTYVALKLFPPM